MRHYYLYIVSSPSHVLYIGVTNDLARRVFEHRHKQIPGFTRRYNVTRLVYFEETSDVRSAIAREKEIKAWRRSKKTALVDSVNPRWLDLAADWFEPFIPSKARNLAPASVTDEIPRRRTPLNDREASSLAQRFTCHSERSEESRPAGTTDEIPRRRTPRNDNLKGACADSRMASR
jgi:putative endonuclease